jgi:Ca2+-binding RTX toxin-like protein
VSDGAGNDVLFGASGDDSLDGAAGNDTLQAGNGDDVLDGGAGADVFRPEGGDDFIGVYDGDASTVETLFGFDKDDDTIVIDVDPGEQPYNYYTISPTGSNSVRIQFFQEGPPGPGDDVLVEVVNVSGGDARLLDQSDIIVG